MIKNKLTDYMAIEWHLDVGADESVADAPVNRLKMPAAGTPEIIKTEGKPPAEPPLGTADAAAEAKRIARNCQSLEELESAVGDFEGCPLKRTAKNTVFKDGNTKARLMLIGEAPGADEDRQGLPFVGASGQLLDRMFKAIGYDRKAEDPKEALYITNILFWRPPGNREPSASEISVCLPFVERHIELIKPDYLIFMGGVAAKALMQSGQGITRLRGKWQNYQSEGLDKPIPATALFHPSYLLGSPTQKKYVWQDLLRIKAKLEKESDSQK